MGVLHIGVKIELLNEEDAMATSKFVPLISLWAFLGLLAEAPLAETQGLKSAAEGYAILNGDPPGVLVVNADLKPIGSIPLSSKPAFATLVPDGAMYVFQDAGACVNEAGQINPHKRPSSVSIVDLKALRVIKTISLGWNVAQVLPSADGRMLITFGIGRPGDKPEEQAAVHSIDTRTHEVVQRYLIGPVAQDILATPDLKRLVVLGARETAGLWIWSKRLLTLAPAFASCFATSNKFPKEGTYHVTILDPEVSAPLRDTPLPGNPTSLLMSSDERWTYILDLGWPDKNPKNDRVGTVHVVDLTGGALAGSHSVGTLPTDLGLDGRDGTAYVLSHVSANDHTGRLYRLRGKDLEGPLETVMDPLGQAKLENSDVNILFAKNEICRTTQPGTPERPCTPFSWSRDLGVKEGRDGWQEVPAGEIQYAKQRGDVLIQTEEKDQKLAIVSLNPSKPPVVLHTGRQDVKGSKDVGVFMINTLLFATRAAGARPGQGYLPPMPKFWTGYRAWPGDSLLVSKNEAHAYSRNYYTNDITVINLDTRAIEQYFAVGGGGGGLLLSDDGKRLWTHGKKQITVIDTEKNEIVWQPETSGDIRQLAPPDQHGVVVAMTDKELILLDPGKSQVVAKFEGLKKPVMFLSTQMEPSATVSGP